MKNLFQNTVALMCTLFFLASVANAQNVPSKVKEAFAKKFPNAKQVEWGKENATEFEAEFVLDGKDMSANFDAEGNWKETETGIAKDELPDAVQQSLNQNYGDAEIEDVNKVLTSEQTTLYEISVVMNENEGNGDMDNMQESGEHNEQNYELAFTTDGKFISKTEVDEEGNN